MPVAPDDLANTWISENGNDPHMESWWVPHGVGVPQPGVKVLAYGKRPTASVPEWHIAMRGSSLLEPEKGVFWFTDAGMVLEVEHWEPLPPSPNRSISVCPR